MPSGELVETLTSHEIAASSLRFIVGGAQLVSLGYEGTIRRWRTGSWEAEQAVAVGQQGPRRVVLSPDERRAALSLEGRVQVWDTASWERGEELDVGTKAVGGLAFSPDGAWFAAGGADGKIRAWRMS
jgi:WD40 repeat protein